MDEGEHAAVRVGAGATNLQMLEWSQKSGWTMPMNIIALMISYGGANATITHGAGINNKNLNDIVIKVLLSRATEKEIQSRKFSAMISKNKRGCRK